MASHNPAYQMGANGPLSPSIRKRIETAKNRLNLTLAEVGDDLGFSGPFVSTLLRNTSPGRVRTKHIDRIVDALEKLEVKAGIRTVLSAHNTQYTPTATEKVNSTPELSMLDLIRAAHKLGFEVSFKPLQGHAASGS